MPARVTVVERQESDGAGATVSPLVVQYAISHRYGTLTLTFVAARAGAGRQRPTAVSEHRPGLLTWATEPPAT